MFMPIAFALISDDGWRGAGGRYIRKFIAVCAQIAVLIVVAKITAGVMSLSTEEVLSAIQEAADYNSLTEAMSKQMTICVGVGFASTQAMFKSISIISDAFGG
jgi:predicted deacetylase